VCNTLKGFDEYARLQLGAKPIRPTQPLWFVHPVHGITARWSVYIDEPGKPATKSSNVRQSGIPKECENRTSAQFFVSRKLPDNMRKGPQSTVYFPFEYLVECFLRCVCH
jgi:hypothetical protein